MCHHLMPLQSVCLRWWESTEIAMEGIKAGCLGASNTVSYASSEFLCELMLESTVVAIEGDQGWVSWGICHQRCPSLLTSPPSSSPATLWPTSSRTHSPSPSLYTPGRNKLSHFEKILLHRPLLQVLIYPILILYPIIPYFNSSLYKLPRI